MENAMDRTQIMDAFRSLARSQGLYGRLCRHIDNLDEESRNAFLGRLEKKNFKNTVDLVMFIEG